MVRIVKTPKNFQINFNLIVFFVGGGLVGGEKQAEVEPFGAVGQSIAFFKDVFFSNCKNPIKKRSQISF